MWYKFTTMRVSDIRSHVKPLVFSTPNLQKPNEICIGKHYAAGIVARVEAYPFRIPKVPVQKELDPVAVWEMFLGKIFCLRVMDKPQRRDGAGKKPQAALHSFR